MMKNTSALVSAELSITSLSIFMLRRLFQAASASAPAQPVPPASVGVAKPPKIEPSTTKISAGRRQEAAQHHAPHLAARLRADVGMERRRQMRLGERQDPL